MLSQVVEKQKQFLDDIVYLHGSANYAKAKTKHHKNLIRGVLRNNPLLLISAPKVNLCRQSVAMAKDGRIKKPVTSVKTYLDLLPAYLLYKPSDIAMAKWIYRKRKIKVCIGVIDGVHWLYSKTNQQDILGQTYYKDQPLLNARGLEFPPFYTACSHASLDTVMENEYGDEVGEVHEDHATMITSDDDNY